MENSKKGNGLTVFLIVLVLLLAVGGTLLFTGIVKSPLIKETKCKETKCKTTKTETKKEEKETRYFQYSADSEQVDDNRNPLPKYYEVELNKDGTAKLGFLRVNDADDKVGIYTEDDKYIIVAVNNTNELCKEINQMIADVCSDTIIFIKDNGVLKTQRSNDQLFHFDIDNVNSSMEYKQVQKSDLQTSLKN